MSCNALINSLIFRQTKTYLITSEKPGVSCGHAVAVCNDSSHSAYGTPEYTGVAHRNKSTSPQYKGKSTVIKSMVHTLTVFIYYMYMCEKMVRVYQIQFHFFVTKAVTIFSVFFN